MDGLVEGKSELNTPKVPRANWFIDYKPEAEAEAEDEEWVW